MKQLKATGGWYNEGEIQHLLVEAARCKSRFPQCRIGVIEWVKWFDADAEDRLVQHVVATVQAEPSKYEVRGIGCDRAGERGTSADQVQAVLLRYAAYLATPAERHKRTYRNDSPHRHKWTRNDIERFIIAFKKYGNSPTSNRKIAQYIGNGALPCPLRH